MGKDQELLEAARNGNISTVEKILQQKSKRSGPLASLRRGPGANVQDSSGYSSLHHASLNGHKEIVELLLSNEASTNIVDVKGSSPLHLAAWSGNVDVVRLLLCHGPSIPNVNLTTKDNETALHCAAQYGHTEVVCLLLEHSCDPTIKNSKHETALDLAAQYGRLETVDMLVRTHPELIQPFNGRSVSVVFPHTPLHLASRNGHKAVVEVLLSGGMNVNVRTPSGTALHEAALCGKSEVVRALLEKGIDLNIRDSQNNTVIDILKQFPGHVVHDIYSIIKNYKSSLYDIGNDSFQVHSLGSPYDNHRNAFGSITPNSISPMHYDCCERRYSGSTSIASDGAYSRYSYNNNPGSYSKSLVETSFLSDEYCRSRDFDTLSICSTTSSNCSHDRRSHTSSNIQLPSPGSVSNKISPTPPKKPPRRNLSISPTHLSPQFFCIASEDNGYESYEYALYKKNQRIIDSDDLQFINGTGKPKENVLRRGKSAEHYFDTKFRHSVMIDMNDKQSNSLVRGKSEDLQQFLDSKYQPTAITSVYGNIPYRTTNPRRKLKRQNNDWNTESCDPSAIISRGDLPFRKVDCDSSQSPITVERIIVANSDRCHSVGILKSSRENLIEEEKNTYLKKPLSACPLSPTHYKQPPTPDHPPPSAVQAENHIHNRIRPLSQEYSNLKRKSRDIETETEDELLLLVFPSEASSTCSLSSNVSLSDTNTVEEFFGDVPFAGLFKGSVTLEMSPFQKLERPKTLQQLKTIYNLPTNNVNMNDNSLDCSNGGTSPKTKGSTSAADTKSLSILSPFDEQEEWDKISEIMASFGSGLVRDSVFVSELEQEFQNRLGLNKIASNNDSAKKLTLSQWLTVAGYSEFENAFLNFGYDDINFINGILNDGDLKELGAVNEYDRVILMQEANKLPYCIENFWKNRTIEINNINNDNGIENSNHAEKKSVKVQDDLVKNWLESINLLCYADIFRKHSYTDIDKIKRIWEVELTAVLEITKPGHRRRILASANVAKSTPANKGGVNNNLEGISADLNQLKSNLQQLKNEIRTKVPENGVGSSNKNSAGPVRHNHKKSRPAPPPPPLSTVTNDLEIRNPSELLVGVPATLRTQWRHKPHVLLRGTVNYVASYLGSTVVKELRGTESTKKSIQKLKKSTSVVDCRVTPDIILAISFMGVKFLNVDDQSLICEHEIRNIHCACQDSEDLTHFAYITKDHASKAHYCHVFCVQTMDQATEVILTLGEAFEVAYQMALKEHFGNKNTNNNNSTSTTSGHTRSHSVSNILEENSANGTNSCNSSPTHTTSHSNSSNWKSSHSVSSTNVSDSSMRVLSFANHARSLSVDSKILMETTTGIGQTNTLKAPIAMSEDI